MADFLERCSGFQHLLCLPPIDPDCLTQLAAGHEAQLMDLLLKGPRVDTEEEQSGTANGNNTKTNKNQQQVASALAAAIKDITTGVAIRNETGFTARARVLALCGWELRAVGLSTDRTASLGSPSNQGLPNHLPPESASLLCTLCGARAGVWTCFPDLQPKGIATATPPRNTNNGGDNGKGDGSIAPHRLSRHVAADISTTIAGGDLQSPPGGDAPAAAAPFGRPTAASDEAPVFGFAALHASAEEEKSTPGKQASFNLNKRLRDPFWDSILAADSEASAEKKKKRPVATPGTGTGAGAGTPPPSLPAPATLRQYRTKILNCIALHRSYCPWVKAIKVNKQGGSAVADDNHTASASEALGAEGHCGWRWCLKQLTGGEGGPGGGDHGQGQDWDPATLLRSVLRTLEMKK